MQARLVKRLVEVDSTNTVAMEMGRQGARSGTVVVAESQTRGRGRLKRPWISPPGTGLYFSMILRPDLDPVDLSKITLVAGVAVCLALEAECHVRLGIKWPNDLLLDNRKLGGILTEAEPSAGGDYLVVLGIGLNITSREASFPDDLRKHATSLLLSTGQRFERDLLLAAIIRRLDEMIPRVEQNGFSEAFAEWRARDASKGRTLSWVTASGEVVEGIGQGLDDNGAYHIRGADGAIHQILSGDLNLASTP